MRHRIRVSFSKAGDLRYLSSLDLSRTLERALRRSGLPIAFTQGFNPRVRLSFPTAWPTGFEVEGASFDFFLEEPSDLDEVSRRLRTVLPPGLDLDGVVLAPPETGARRDDPVVVELRRTDAEPLLLPEDRDPSPAALAAAGLRRVEAREGRIRLEFDPCSGGARIRAAVSSLGLEGPLAPPVVARLLAPPGDSPLG